MSKVRIGVNGLGRIGRCVMRAIVEQGYDDIEIAAVNGPAPSETHVHLLKYDSVHGVFSGKVEATETEMQFGNQKFPIFHARDLNQIDWGKVGADIILECTGVFTDSKSAGVHLERGAKKVLISAPAKDSAPTIVFGVNNYALKPSDNVLSIGSCTTNGLAPVAKVLNEAFGIEKGYMTTIHAFTGDQNLVDGSHKDLRRARAATLSMVPTSTGAAKALGLVLPELEGKLSGTSIRVPTPNVSMIDLTFTSARPMTKDSIHTAIKAASEGALKGILAVNSAPLVSIDFTHHPASSIFDTTGTAVIGDNFARVAAWYDNEWGFSCRMLDVARLVASQA